MTAPSFRTSRTMTVVLGIAACLVVGYIVLYPDQILQSSLEGLSIWWKIVFPALLPFLIIIEMMSALGVMHFIGTWLDPVMRRLFGLPGIAGWCLAVGWMAGSPAGATDIAQLRRDKRLTRLQAERLLAMSHTGSPVVLIIVIAAGFLGKPEFGLPLLVIHWLGAAIVGVADGRRHDPELADLQTKPRHAPPSAERSGLLAGSLLAMEEARRADGRPFGKLLGDSVFDSIQKLMVVGGYMIFFSVLLKIFILSGAGRLILQAADSLFVSAGLPAGLSAVLFNGLFEQHLGAYTAPGNGLQPDVWTMAAISAVLGWSGLCLHAQVKAATAGSDLRYYPFLLSRLLHAVTAAAVTLLAYPLFRQERAVDGFRNMSESIAVWSELPPMPAYWPDYIEIIKFHILLLILTAGLLFLLTVVSAALHKFGQYSGSGR